MVEHSPQILASEKNTHTIVSVHSDCAITTWHSDLNITVTLVEKCSKDTEQFVLTAPLAVVTD